jgi:hypothetical protein
MTYVDDFLLRLAPPPARLSAKNSMPWDDNTLEGTLDDMVQLEAVRMTSARPGRGGRAAAIQTAATRIADSVFDDFDRTHQYRLAPLLDDVQAREVKTRLRDIATDRLINQLGASYIAIGDDISGVSNDGVDLRDDISTQESVDLRDDISTQESVDLRDDPVWQADTDPVDTVKQPTSGKVVEGRGEKLDTRLAEIQDALQTPQKVHMVFDTETTGIHRDSQVIALAWMIMRNDSDGTEVERYHSLWRLSTAHKWSPEAEKVHGISRERLDAEGQDPRGELRAFFSKVDEVQRSGGYIVAHNLQFDEARINATAIANKFEPLWPEGLRRLCTLVTMRSVVWGCSRKCKWEDGFRGWL